MTTHAKLGLSTLVTAWLLTPGCSLIGVEPDEIDLADESGTGSLTATSNEGSTNGGDGDGDSGATDTEDQGDGDGDSGDGDPSTGPGDGDGDAGDGDAGDGDGDTGDGDGESCELLEPLALEETLNVLDIPNVMSSFEGTCGGSGPEAVFSFTATSDTTYEFTLASDELDGVLYLVEGCNPLDEIACEPEGQTISYAMGVGEVVYIIVDSNAGAGAATLTIAAI
jgi:hypothetical protein